MELLDHPTDSASIITLSAVISVDRLDLAKYRAEEELSPSAPPTHCEKRFDSLSDQRQGDKYFPLVANADQHLSSVSLCLSHAASAVRYHLYYQDVPVRFAPLFEANP
jgi:hypothetical protein